MRIETDVELASRTSLKVGGRARWFVQAESEADVTEAITYAERQSLRLLVLGGGSNVVVPDAGIDGLVLAVALRELHFQAQAGKTRLTAAAGEPWDALVEDTVERGLSGLECLSGIPGQVGATPLQNVGAYGQEVAQTLSAVRAFDRKERHFVTLTREQCSFGYRDSRFKAADRERFVITSVSFLLEHGPPGPIRYPELERSLLALGRPPSLYDVRNAVLALRRSKSMLGDSNDPNARSCGSFFMNPIVSNELAHDLNARFAPLVMPRYPQSDGRIKLSAAWLIERAGFVRGTRQGNVGLSSRHALALVCHEGATARELMAFAERVQAGVLEHTGVVIAPEPVLW